MVEGSICEKEAAKIIIKLVSAIQYLQGLKIIHRDLKPENLMFKSLDSDEIKIIDFGLGKKFHDYRTQIKRKQSKVGTPLYVAPEVLSQK